MTAMDKLLASQCQRSFPSARPSNWRKFVRLQHRVSDALAAEVGIFVNHWCQCVYSVGHSLGDLYVHSLGSLAEHVAYVPAHAISDALR
jgi:predicted adenine nucleotide alpha hydrolase (AANH) superfamily ATPase